MMYSLMNELSFSEQIQIQGGSFWGFVAGVCDCLGGIAMGIAGGLSLCVPEPTTALKYGGKGAIINGFFLFEKGCDEIISSF